MAERNLAIGHVAIWRWSNATLQNSASAVAGSFDARMAPGVSMRPNVDGNPSYPKAISELKQTAKLGRRCRCRPVPYLNNILEQDHRSIKRRVRAKSRIPILRRGLKNESRNRNGPHDSERSGPMLTQGCDCRTTSVRSGSLRDSNCRVIGAVQHSIASVFPVCNTSSMAGNSATPGDENEERPDQDLVTNTQKERW